MWSAAPRRLFLFARRFDTKTAAERRTTLSRVPRLDHPRVRAQVVERANHRVADAQLLPPAERLQLRGVEEDERAVADPPARPAGVVHLRLQPQPVTNPTERVID